MRKLLVLLAAWFLFSSPGTGAGAEWIRTARVFLIDGYEPPFAPELEFDAEALAKTMQEMNANTVRISTVGKYAYIQGVRFTPHRALGKRDALAEMIAAARPRGIRVIPYISTGHKLAWSMVTREYPEYAHRPRPGGEPERSHMFAGEDHGTVCWNTPYRKAFLDLVEHVVRDYAIDGLYFDTWRPFYFWQGLQVCYCDGCRTGFHQASGLEIPWHERPGDYTPRELETIERYHAWYRERLIEVIGEVRRLVKSHKDIPLISNIGNPRSIEEEDRRVLSAMDAFLYERGDSLLERAEGITLARAAGLGVWPYIGVYNNWPRTIYNALDYQQQIFTTAMFGGAPILAQPQGYVEHAENRRFVSYPFSVLKAHERELAGFENVPYVAVVYGYRNPPGHERSGWWWKAETRTATEGAFAACLSRHIQVSSVPERILDESARLERYSVVYLAGTPHLTGQRVENLKRFVERGGGLVVSYAASLYDAGGKRQERFSLEELIRVKPARREGALTELLDRYDSMLGGPYDLYLLARSGAMAGKLIPLWYFEPVEALAGGVVVMDIVTGDGRRPVLPGVVCSRHGRGRVAYLASSIESLFLQENGSALGDAVLTLVATVAPGPPPYTVEAPESLVVNLTERGARWVLHMTNWSGGLGDSGRSRYELPAIEGVTVRLAIPEGRTLRRVTTLVEGPVVKKAVGQAFELRFSKIGAYQGVALELE